MIYRLQTNREFTLPGRSLLLVRNAGHLMTADTTLDNHGNEALEGIPDAMVTAAYAIQDFTHSNPYKNSHCRGMYVVQPKMHSPETVAFTCELLSCVEDTLNLQRNTVKIGVMNEERYSTTNLKECISGVSERLVFINTGFLDRIGNEVHTRIEAGPFLPNGDIKQQPWISTYSDINDVGFMEDRAALRISSQHIANWLRYEICDETQAMASHKYMTVIINRENGDNKNYRPMAENFEEGIAFQAACGLIFKSCEQANGYTKLLLHYHRRVAKEEYNQ